MKHDSQQLLKKRDSTEFNNNRINYSPLFDVTSLLGALTAAMRISGSIELKSAVSAKVYY